MFEVFFDSNFVNLWSEMLKYLKENNDIENGKIFFLAKKTIQDAIKFKRLDFIIKSLKYYRSETEKILCEEDIYYELLSLINETKYFSDILCIVSQFYKQIRNRKHQEYLIEIFSSMLTNSNTLLSNNNNQSSNVFSQNLFQMNGGDQRGNKSINNSPKSMRFTNNFEMCESQVYSQDIYKYNLNLSYLLFTLSPIITATIIAKIFYVLSRQFHSPLKQKLYHIAKEYLTIAIAFSLEIDDLRDWKLLLFNTVYPSRYSLIQMTINYKEFFYPLLSLENIKNTIFIKWKSEYAFSYNFLVCSSSWNVLQDMFDYKKGTFRDLPPFVPIINSAQDGYPITYQYNNMSQFQSQSKFDEMSVKRNVAFNCISNSKISIYYFIYTQYLPFYKYHNFFYFQEYLNVNQFHHTLHQILEYPYLFMNGNNCYCFDDLILNILQTVQVFQQERSHLIIV